jgi:hypothetical protein
VFWIAFLPFLFFLGRITLIAASQVRVLRALTMFSRSDPETWVITECTGYIDNNLRPAFLRKSDWLSYFVK